MTIRITGIFCPMRQKSTDHREGHHRQPDAAQIPGHDLYPNIPAGRGRNDQVIKIDGIFCPSPQKEKTGQVDRDHSAGAAETG